MKFGEMGEDIRMSARSIQRRLVESLLLIIGIALGIGATAAGFAMVVRSVREADELLGSTQYREILVTIREDAEDMDLPATRQESDETIILTSADLVAREETEDIQYAYIMNRTLFRLGVPNFRGFGGGAGPGGQEESVQPEVQQEGTDSAVKSDGTTQRPDRGEGTGNPESTDTVGTTESSRSDQTPDWLQDLQVPEISGPEPVLEEMEGYMVSPEFFSAWDLHAAEGSLFTLSDMEEPLLILGSELAKNLFGDGESLGREVLMNLELYSIVGILEPTDSSYDEMAFVPAFMADLQGLDVGFNKFISWNTSLYFTVADTDRLDEAESQLTSWFESEYGPGLVNISIPREEAEQTRDRTSRLVTIILFLALSGLLIASVNVSNILFSRALRKRRVVGILKALGASVGSVFRMFFMEALFISLGGAVVGAGLAVTLSRLMETTVGFAAISGLMLTIGVVISWLITKALTILPSMQAAKIPAAEAIRYE